MTPGGLGRRRPKDFEHVLRYPLGALPAAEQPRSVPVQMGTDWYAEFDRPERDSSGHWWVARDGRLTTVRGGHSFCLRPAGVSDLTAWWRFYDQGHEGACFRAGTLIRMADGSHRPIEDVRPFERVLTAEGNEGYVLGVMGRLHTEGMVSVALCGHRGVLSLTPEHPIRTARGYIAAGELTVGDEVWLPAYAPDTRGVLRPREVVAEYEERRVTTTGTRHWTGVAGRAAVTHRVAALPEAIALDASFGRIVGLFLAEGTTTAQKVSWSFGGHERDTLVPDLERLLVDIGAAPRVQVRGNGSLTVTIYGKHWRLLFERLFVLGPYDKTLGRLADGPQAFLRAVFEGWLAGDGHRRRRVSQGVTVSKRLALDMYAAAHALGLAPTLSRRDGKPNASAASRRARYDVTVADGPPKGRLAPGGIWRKVTALDLEDWAGPVYNLHVEGDESYVAEGVGVHNCVGFAGARMMTLLNRTRYDARWLWNAAKSVDEWPDTNPGDDNGTSVRAACDVLRNQGIERSGRTAPTLGDGIAANRWATTADEVLAALGTPGHGYVQVLNSWGEDYPHLVRMPAEVLDRLIRADGEAAIVTDR